jgi:hypothetical protein
MVCMFACLVSQRACGSTYKPAWVIELKHEPIMKYCVYCNQLDARSHQDVRYAKLEHHIEH